jgi:hypothetical protein
MEFVSDDEGAGEVEELLVELSLVYQRLVGGGKKRGEKLTGVGDNIAIDTGLKLISRKGPRHR